MCYYQYQTLRTGIKYCIKNQSPMFIYHPYIHNIHPLSRKNDDIKTSLMWI